MKNKELEGIEKYINSELTTKLIKTEIRLYKSLYCSNLSERAILKKILFFLNGV